MSYFKSTMNFFLGVKKDQISQAQKIVTDTLERIVPWNVPLKVKVRTGNNWQEVTTYGRSPLKIALN